MLRRMSANAVTDDVLFLSASASVYESVTPGSLVLSTAYSILSSTLHLIQNCSFNFHERFFAQSFQCRSDRYLGKLLDNSVCVDESIPQPLCQDFADLMFLAAIHSDEPDVRALQLRLQLFVKFCARLLLCLHGPELSVGKAGI